MSSELAHLGDLERAVLRYAWREGEADVKTVHADIGERRDISHKTVQSALKRLYEKGLLDRRKEGRAYVYGPRADQTEVTEQRVAEVVDELAGGDTDVALEAFVDFAERAGEETLEQLEELIGERRSSDGEG